MFIGIWIVNTVATNSLDRVNFRKNFCLGETSQVVLTSVTRTSSLSSLDVVEVSRMPQWRTEGNIYPIPGPPRLEMKGEIRPAVSILDPQSSYIFRFWRSKRRGFTKGSQKMELAVSYFCHWTYIPRLAHNFFRTLCSSWDAVTWNNRHILIMKDLHDKHSHFLLGGPWCSATK